MTDLERVIADSLKLSPLSKKAYLSALRRFLDFAGEHPTNWTPVAATAWRDAMIASGISLRSVAANLAAVRSASKRWAAVHDARDFMPAVESPRAEVQAPQQVLTLDQCRQLVAACAGSDPSDLRDRSLILAGITTGVRCAELQQLQIAPWPQTVRAKGGKPQQVRLVGEALDATAAWVTWLGAKSGPIWRRLRLGIDRLVPGKDSLSHTAIYQIIRTRAESVGIFGVHPHTLRHTHVSLALDAGIEPWRVQKSVGHVSLATTGRYAHDLAEDPIATRLPPLVE